MPGDGFAASTVMYNFLRINLWPVSLPRQVVTDPIAPATRLKKRSPAPMTFLLILLPGPDPAHCNLLLPILWVVLIFLSFPGNRVVYLLPAPCRIASPTPFDVFLIALINHPAIFRIRVVFLHRSHRSSRRIREQTCIGSLTSKQIERAEELQKTGNHGWTCAVEDFYVKPNQVCRERWLRKCCLRIVFRSAKHDGFCQGGVLVAYIKMTILASDLQTLCKFVDLF